MNNLLRNCNISDDDIFSIMLYSDINIVRQHSDFQQNLSRLYRSNKFIKLKLSLQVNPNKITLGADLQNHLWLY